MPILNMVYYAAEWGGWWKPWANTIAYYDFENNLNDTSGNWNNATWSNVLYEQVWGQYVVKNDNNCQIQIPQLWASIGNWDFTIAFWLNAINPWSWQYPMLFGLWTDTSYYAYIFYDPLNNYGWWDKIVWQMNWVHYFGTASSLYNSWHHLAMIRRSWTVYCYIDGTEVGNFSATTTFWGNWTSYIFSRYQSYNGHQYWGNTWAKADKYIIEKVWWSASDVADYYNQTKSTYGY